MRKVFILSLLIGTATVCDPGTGELFYIDNKSDFDITVEYKIWNLDTIITAASNQNTLIYEDYYLGKANNSGEDFLMKFDTIFILVNDTLAINKDYLKRENWDFSITGGDGGFGDGGLSNYSLVIENKDIVKKDN